MCVCIRCRLRPKPNNNIFGGFVSNTTDTSQNRRRYRHIIEISNEINRCGAVLKHFMSMLVVANASVSFRVGLTSTFECPRRFRELRFFHRLGRRQSDPNAHLLVRTFRVKRKKPTPGGGGDWRIPIRYGRRESIKIFSFDVQSVPRRAYIFIQY